MQEEDISFWEVTVDTHSGWERVIDGKLYKYRESAESIYSSRLSAFTRSEWLDRKARGTDRTVKDSHVKEDRSHLKAQCALKQKRRRQEDTKVQSHLNVEHMQMYRADRESARWRAEQWHAEWEAIKDTPAGAAAIAASEAAAAAMRAQYEKEADEIGLL